MYYLEDLTLQDIRFLSALLEDYRIKNIKTSEDGKISALPTAYHSVKVKIKRLTKFATFNPNETDTPKQTSKYSVFKKQLKRDFPKETPKGLHKIYRLKKDIKNETIKNTQETY
jgi:hypothetical protein